MVLEKHSHCYNELLIICCISFFCIFGPVSWCNSSLCNNYKQSVQLAWCLCTSCIGLNFPAVKNIMCCLDLFVMFII